MIVRAATIVLVSLLASIIGYGQSSFRGLTPGQSTRAEAERALGSPTKEVSKTLIEYKSPEAAEQLYVQYSDGSPAGVVERIERSCQSQMGTPICEKFSEPFRNVELDVRVKEKRNEQDPRTKATVYFGAPRFIRFVEIWKGNDYEYRMSFMSPELYESAVPKSGCTGSILGSWETMPGTGRDFDLGRVTIERVGDNGIKGVYQKNNGTLTLKRAWQDNENFVYGRSKYKGEWKDDTGGGTIEIEVESFNDFHTAEAKLTRTSGTSQATGTSKNSKAAALEAIIRGFAPSWRGNCVP